MKKMVMLTVCLFSVLVLIPTVSAMAYGRNFYFNLRFGTDNDNAQCDAFREETLMTNYADIYVLSQTNANNNVKFKVLGKDYTGAIIGEATNQRKYTSSYFQKALKLTYNDKFLYSEGTFALYGNCVTKDCLVSGNWTP